MRVNVLCIGDTVVDAFIRLHNADIHCELDHHNCTITLPYGAKIPYDSATVVYGVGNSANAAVCVSRLGLSSALVTNLGKDENGNIAKQKLQEENVNTDLVDQHEGVPTNYHYVLWYKDERTILINHHAYKRNFDFSRIPDCDYMYLSSLGADSLEYHKQILTWLHKNPYTKLVFQPGTFQMQVGQKTMAPFYDIAYVFVCNVEEAQYILGVRDSDIKSLLNKMHQLGPKIVLITDGPKGAYLYDAGKYYYMPIYPDIAPPVERTGAGDAFTSTFISALAYGLSPKDALTWAPINSMNVVQHIGAQEGLLTKDKLQEFLLKAPKEYIPKEI